MSDEKNNVAPEKEGPKSELDYSSMLVLNTFLNSINNDAAKWLYLQSLYNQNNKKMEDKKDNEKPVESTNAENVSNSFSIEQLTKSQELLNDYYQTNLKQLKIVFWTGIIILGFGIALILTTLLYSLISTDTNPFVLVSGYVSGILVDFIGAMFISMHTKTSESANSFLHSLTDITSKHLGNVVAEQIQDKALKDTAFSEISKQFSSNSK